MLLFFLLGLLLFLAWLFLSFEGNKYTKEDKLNGVGPTEEEKRMFNS